MSRKKKQRICREPNCDYPAFQRSPRCGWHWALRQPIELQIEAADYRLSRVTGPHRARVPESEWPAGERWCSGCQSFVPLFYTRGSRCIACASRATHASHVVRTYGLDPDEYERLLRWQGGVCYICHKRPRKRRLAVDHDHATGLVRGLLCADDEWGCNRAVLGIVTHLEMARRVVAYYEKTPIERMRDGEPPPLG